MKISYLAVTAIVLLSTGCSKVELFEKAIAYERDNAGLEVKSVELGVNRCHLVASSMGGAIVVHNCPAEEIQQRVDEDPFVKEGIVKAEIHEITPAMTDDRMAFLMND